jgi:hypothetical protein
MSDWKYVQMDPTESLAQLHFFSVKKKHGSSHLDVRITVHEFATPDVGALQFFAMADIELNQKTAKYQPSGWSDTLMGALSECMRNLRRFEYEGPDRAAAPSGH